MKESMERVTIQQQKRRQIRTTRVVLLSIAAIFAILVVESFVMGNGGGRLSPLSIFKGAPSLSINAEKTTKAPSAPPPMVGEAAVEVDDSRGHDSDLGKDHPDPHHEEIEMDLEDGGTVPGKTTKGAHFTIERPEGRQQAALTNSTGESVFSMNNDTDSSPKFDHGSDESSNISVYQILSPTLQSAPPPPVANMPVVPRKPRKPRKRDVLKLKTYYQSDMEQFLIQNRASPQSMLVALDPLEQRFDVWIPCTDEYPEKPQWPSQVDRQLLHARAQIEKAPIVSNDPDLYAPAFRNISMFKRSYELMEQNLKVYVYKEGDQPIFHKPFFTGIYASEGWFMKHMEENKHFLVNDPGKAHLFYIPFSSRMLQSALFDYKTRSKKKMYDYLRNYITTISSKYPFWNRTGGADHFVASCHDWAARETGRTIETSMRALCNADIHEGFEVGKDISLPQTNVRHRSNPLRGRGGKPAGKRTTLAFFAGQMHGYLRPILLQHWENRDPGMKILGKMPHFGRTTIRKNGKRKRTNMYLDYMKGSKYCICPRGYEVNSPRLVEAIFYECVPVIISDNYVPPFFEILNWEAFSLILPESDVPRLKEILTSIPQEKYEALHSGVRRVQKHFSWNKKPVKYDLFHMILHNAWFNRVFRLRVE